MIDTANMDRIARKYLNTAEGRAKIAQSLEQPLRSRRDYLSVGRKAFLAQQLPDGALAIYDKDPDVIAYYVGEEGENIVSVAKSRRVSCPLLEIAANPEVPLSQVREKRFDVIQRVQDQGRAMIQAAEDTRVFAIMDQVALNGYDTIGAVNPVIPAAAPVTIPILAEAWGQIEENDLAVERVFMNPRDATDLRKVTNASFDFETQREVLNSGILGTLWGAKLVSSRIVPRGKIYVTATPEMFGRIPIRQELTVLSADNPAARTIGFSMFENLGFLCHNPRGLTVVDITR